MQEGLSEPETSWCVGEDQSGGPDSDDGGEELAGGGDTPLDSDTGGEELAGGGGTPLDSDGEELGQQPAIGRTLHCRWTSCLL